MKEKVVEGLIISETNYSESSKILNVLTRDLGVIGIMSKGCRNIKSKLRGTSRKLVHANFSIRYKENGVSTLVSVDLINSYSNTLMDLEKISYASYILDICKQIVRQNDDLELFDLVVNSLDKIEEGFNPLIITNIFSIKALDFLGVRPSIDCCSMCGSTSDIITLSSDAGGYLCRNCYTNQELVSDKTIKIIRLFYYVDISNITKLDVSKEVVTEINNFLNDYYDRYTGLYLKSKDFMKQVNSLKVVKE